MTLNSRRRGPGDSDKSDGASDYMTLADRKRLQPIDAYDTPVDQPGIAVTYADIVPTNQQQQPADR